MGIFRHLAIIICMLSVACAPKREKTVDWKACGLADDQASTFMPPLPVRPSQVIIDPNFTAAEQNEIEAAVLSWNGFSNGAFNQMFFHTITGTTSGNTTSGDPRDCESIGGSDMTVPVVKVTNSSYWASLGMGPSIPAATFRCYLDEVLTRQVIMVFQPMIPEAQLRTVILHEIGHAVGLDHSCEDGSGSAGFRSCSGLRNDHPYKEAVMAPSIRLSNSDPELKEDLRTNDSQRAACLYRDL